MEVECYLVLFSLSFLFSSSLMVASSSAFSSLRSFLDSFNPFKSLIVRFNSPLEAEIYDSWLCLVVTVPSQKGNLVVFGIPAIIFALSTMKLNLFIFNVY